MDPIPHPHPGITMHRIKVGAGPMGFLCAVGFILLAWLGLPQVRWFLLFSLPVGLAAAALFRYLHHRKPVEISRLKIFPPS